MSAPDHRRHLPKRVATWQLARSYCLTLKTRQADRGIPRSPVTWQGWDVADWRFLPGLASGATQPQARSFCLHLELPAGDSKAEAGAAALNGGCGRP